MFRSSQRIIRQLGTSSLKFVPIAGVRVLPEPLNLAQQRFFNTAARAFSEASEAVAQESSDSQVQIEEKQPMQMQGTPKPLDAKMQIALKFVEALSQPLPKEPQERKILRQQLLQALNEYKSNPEAGKRYLDNLTVTLQAHQQQLSDLDVALCAYMNMVTFVGYSSQQLFDSHFPWGKNWEAFIIKQIHRLLQLAGSRDTTVHANALYFVIGQILNGKKQSYSILAFKAIRGLLEALVFSPPERFAAVLTQAEKINLVGMGLSAVHKLNHKQNVISQANRAIAKFSDASELHDGMLWSMTTNVMTADNIPQMLDTVRRFETKFPDYQVSSYVFDNLFIKASMVQHESAKLTVLQQFKDYFFVERPRRTVTAEYLSALLRFDLDKALEIRDSIAKDPTMDGIAWNGQLVFSLLVSASQQHRTDVVRSLVEELVQRFKSSKVDMTKPPYLLWRTEAQRKRLEGTGVAVARLLKQESDKQLIVNLKKLIEFEQNVKYDDKQFPKDVKVVYAPVAQASLLIELPKASSASLQQQQQTKLVAEPVGDVQE